MPDTNDAPFPIASSDTPISAKVYRVIVDNDMLSMGGILLVTATCSVGAVGMTGCDSWHMTQTPTTFDCRGRLPLSATRILILGPLLGEDQG